MPQKLPSGIEPPMNEDDHASASVRLFRDEPALPPLPMPPVWRPHTRRRYASLAVAAGLFALTVLSTLAAGAQALKDEGAVKVVAYITHAILSGNAIEKITKSAIDELVVTDTIPLSPAGKQCGRIRQLSVAGLLAETIRRIRDEDSVSSLYLD